MTFPSSSTVSEFPANGHANMLNEDAKMALLLVLLFFLMEHVTSSVGATEMTEYKKKI